MLNFKIGDLVEVVKERDTNPTIKVGDRGTITKLNYAAEEHYSIDFGRSKSGIWWFEEREIKLIVEPKFKDNEQVIVLEDRATGALVKKGEKVTIVRMNRNFSPTPSIVYEIRKEDGQTFNIREHLLKKYERKFEVSEEFIRAGHKAACSEWKGKIEKQFPQLFEFSLEKVLNDYSTKEITRTSWGGLIAARFEDNSIIVPLHGVATYRWITEFQTYFETNYPDFKIRFEQSPFSVIIKKN